MFLYSDYRFFRQQNIPYPRSWRYLCTGKNNRTIMNIYIITWIIIVGALALTFVFRAIENFRKECGNKEGDPHFFEISKDTELFYCPGDEYLADEQDCM